MLNTSGPRALFLLLLCLLPLLAGGCSTGIDPQDPGELASTPAHVEQVRLTQQDDLWQVAVTVLHPDNGWEHYADWWRITDADGNELARRVLRHPHVDEQPFTRSLPRVSIPAEVGQLVVEAHCLVHGSGGRTVTVDLLLDRGPGYTIQREHPEP